MFTYRPFFRLVGVVEYQQRKSEKSYDFQLKPPKSKQEILRIVYLVISLKLGKFQLGNLGDWEISRRGRPIYISFNIFKAKLQFLLDIRKIKKPNCIPYKIKSKIKIFSKVNSGTIPFRYVKLGCQTVIICVNFAGYAF